MATAFELEFTEDIYYSIGNNPSIKEIIESLQGWEALILQSKGVLSKLTKSKITHIEVRVSNLVVGSLMEKIIVKLGFGSQEECDKFFENAHTKLIGKGKMRSVIVWTVLGGLLFTGMQTLVPSKEAAKIEANNNVFINIGAGETDISPEMIKSVLNSNLVDKKQLAKNTLKVLSPSRNDPASTITMGAGKYKGTVTSDTINVVPKEMPVNQKYKTIDYADVDLEIRKLDLDNMDNGWAAVIPGLVDRRVTLTFAPDIDPNTISHKFVVRADVQVIYKLSGGKKQSYKPNEIYLKSIVTPDLEDDVDDSNE